MQVMNITFNLRPRYGGDICGMPCLSLSAGGAHRISTLILKPKKGVSMNHRRFLSVWKKTACLVNLSYCRSLFPILTVVVLAVGIALTIAPPVRADTVVIDEDTKDELLRMLDDLFDGIIDLKLSMENDISSHILNAKEDILIAKEVIHYAQQEVQTDPDSIFSEIQTKKKKAEKYVDKARDDKDNGNSGIEDVMDVKRNLEDLVENFIKVVEEALEDGKIDATLAADIIDEANTMVMDLEYKNNLLLLIQFRIFKADENLHYAKSWLELANEVLCKMPGTTPWGDTCIGSGSTQDLLKAKEYLYKAEKELEEALRHLKRVQKFEEKFLENIKRNLHRSITDMRKLIVEARPGVAPGAGVTAGVGGVLPFSKALTILATQDTNAARFEALGLAASEIRVEVFGLNGAKLFDSGFTPGNKLAWRLNTDAGEIIANGVYLYVVTVKNYNGEAIRSEAKKLVVLR